MDVGSPQTYSVKTIAKILDMSERNVMQLAAEGTIPRQERGKYNPIACIQAYIRYLRKLVQGTGSLSLTEERTRLTKVQADIAELELAISKGKLVPVEIAGKLWEKIIIAFRAKLLVLPTKLAPVLTGKKSTGKIKEIIEKYVKEVLEELTTIDASNYIAEFKNKAFEATTQPKRKRVVRKKPNSKPEGKLRARKVETRESPLSKGNPKLNK